MRNYVQSLYFFLFIGLIAGLASCDTTDTDQQQGISITGQVIDKNSGDPLANAVIRIISPPPQKVQTTNDEGMYAFTREVDSSHTITLEARKEGYDIVRQEIFAIPGRDITMPDIKLISQDTSKGEPPASDRETGGAASIQLQSVDPQKISVRGTGGVENSKFTFQVMDSAGRPVNMEHQAEVNFKVLSGPDGGESISPSVAKTDEDGLVSGNLSSGTKAGVVKVQAIIDRGSFTVKSTPISVAIHGGFPYADNFSVAAEQLNFAGCKFGLTNDITAYVGDKYGNIVRPGTAVYFTTDGGRIEGSDETDEKGEASVQLFSGDPPDNGFATVKAKTINENDEEIVAETIVLFSCRPSISVTPESFEISNGGSQEFDYTVQDQNGNPLAPGTSIQVSAEGEEIDVIGDVDITLGDYQQSGNGTTDFTFTVSDAEGDTVVTDPVHIKISTSGPNGEAQLSITGTKNKSVNSNGIKN